MSTAIPGVTSLHAGGSSVCFHEPRASHQTSFEDHSYVTYPGPVFPLKGPGLSDMSFWLQGLEDGLTVNDLDRLTAMCISVSKSQGCATYPASKEGKYIRGKHSFAGFGPSHIVGDRMVFPDADADLVSWDLPAHGEKGKRCGPLLGSDGVQSVAGCCGGSGYEAHYGRLRRFHCDSLQCTDWHCLKAASLRSMESRRGTEKGTVGPLERLLAVRALYPDDHRARFVHLVYSWDPSKGYDWAFSRKAFNRKLREAYKVLEGLGVLGGIAVFHPFSWKGDGEGDKKLMPSDALGSGLEWSFRPHLHVVAYGFVKGAEKHYSRTGDVVSVLSYKNEHGGRLGEEDLRSIMSYCVSHAGVGLPLNGSGRALNVMRAFGACYDITPASRNVRESTETECPVCKCLHGVHRPLYDLHEWRDDRPSAEPLLRLDFHAIVCRRSDLGHAREILSG